MACSPNPEVHSFTFLFIPRWYLLDSHFCLVITTKGSNVQNMELEILGYIIPNPRNYSRYEYFDTGHEVGHNY